MTIPSKPSYTSYKIFDINLVAIGKSKVVLKLNKSTYIGMCILELRKVLMYEFHYDYIKNKYDKESKLLFTNTDSLTYEFETEDVCEGFSSDEEMFDFSNYSAKSKWHDDSSKLVFGKMKDKTAGIAITEFIWLKPKMCSLLVGNSVAMKMKTFC